MKGPQVLAIAVGSVLGLAACSAPSRDAVKADQQRGFSQCVARHMLQPTPVDSEVTTPREARHGHGSGPPASPTPDIARMDRACQ